MSTAFNADDWLPALAAMARWDHDRTAAECLRVKGFHPGDFRRALRDLNLTPTERVVAVELCEYAGPERPIVWPSNRTLADRCGMSRPGVIGILSRLAAKSVILCAARSKGGRGCTTPWLLVAHLPRNCLRPLTVSGLETVNEDPSKLSTGTPKTVNGGLHELERELERELGGAAPGAPPPASEAAQLGNDPPNPSGHPANQSANPAWVAAAAIAAPQPGPEPPRRCPNHIHWDAARRGEVPNCRPCGDARKAHEAWQASAAAAEKATRSATRAAIDGCPDCDGAGRLDDLSDCPKHPNFRQIRAS